MPKLVEDWKQLHRWLSVQMAAFLGAITIAYDNLAVLQQALEASLFHKIQAAIAIAVVAARVIQQSPTNPQEQPK
jgi:hypothetical protein